MDIKRNPQRSKPGVTKKPTPTSANPQSIKPTAISSSLMDDLNETLSQIDDNKGGLDKNMSKYTTETPNTPGNKKRKVRKPWSKKRKIITWSLVAIVVLFVGVTGYYINRIASNTGGMFDGNLLGLIKKDKLQQDSNGRSNILIFGTSEDDEGHSGALLADSIIVLSIDQETKDAWTVSIPRDLWVDYNSPCNLGSEGKINATYVCALEANNDDQSAASLAFADKVGEVIGTDVQYYISVNYSVVRGLVDSLGGVEVTINSEDPRGLYDVTTGLNLPNGAHQINGKTALDLARSRNSKGGYGLSKGNFDREKNQQEVLKAIQAKALSSGTLLDINKVVSITESLGNNVKSNVKGSELRTALEVASGIQSSKIKSKILNDTDNLLVTTGNHNGASIVMPVKGLKDYSDIQKFLFPSKDIKGDK